MDNPWLPRILKPDFTWRHRSQELTISKTTPPVPHVPGRTKRLIWGKVHKMLKAFSERYCSWFHIRSDPHIVQLPFGLVMKWHDRTSLEEVAAMQMARAGGIPVPKLLCCGEHPNHPYNFKYSILMTRLSGDTLENSDDTFSVEEEGPWLNELRTCLHSMRSWTSPQASHISSVIGTSLRSQRVPRHIMGPFENPSELYKYLLDAASPHAFKSLNEYEETILHAKRLQQPSHRITFTHGDLKAHNILVDEDGHLSGFLDWESAGWYPEYWDFTTAMRFGMDSWWYQVASWMGGDKYLDELASDKALNDLTVDSYIHF